MNFTTRVVHRLALGLAAGLISSAVAVAQPAGTDSGTEGLPYVARGHPDTTPKAQAFRESGERACKQAVDAAALLGEQLHDFSLHLSRTMVQASGDLTRGMAQSMDRFSQHLREMADRMERYPGQDD
jgi:hypothetical protein